MQLSWLLLVLPQVRETQKTIRDGRTGAESMTIARGMGQQVGLLLTSAVLSLGVILPGLRQPGQCQLLLRSLLTTAALASAATGLRRLNQGHV